jgi:hypothetical protein
MGTRQSTLSSVAYSIAAMLSARAGARSVRRTARVEFEVDYRPTLTGEGRVTPQPRAQLRRPVTQAVITVIPALLAAYFLFGTRVNWTVLVLGLAWRAWLFLYTLPFLTAGLRAGRPN